MTDVFTKEKRSEIMAAIHNRGNKSTEERLEKLLVDNGITGWRINAVNVRGKPDFVFDERKIAIFVDGCFWHGCPDCRNIPATNTEFWLKKVGGTKQRDIGVNEFLRNEGWRVLRFWEHEIKKQPTICLERIKNSLT